MATAIGKRMESYQQDIDDRLGDARIRHRVDLPDYDDVEDPADLTITVRIADAADLDSARRIVEEADPDLVVVDGADGKSLNVRMTDTQIRERQDFAIEQNMTTLRSRVDQLGVAEPLVQRQGVDVSTLRERQARSICVAADDRGDLSAKFARFNGLENGLEIGAATGYQDHQRQRHTRVRFAFRHSVQRALHRHRCWPEKSKCSRS